MSFLSNNVIYSEPEHMMITIVGEPGMGKTTLAAMCAAPLFVRSEQGTRGLSNEVARLPVVQNSKDLFSQLTAILKEDHEYKTLVFDTVTALDVIFAREIIASDNRASTINDAKGGYGAGFSALADLHHRVHKAASMIMNQRGMNIVFLGHTDIKTINPPDSEPYMKYVLRMHDKSSDPYVNGVDAVGFIRQEVFYKKDRGARVGKVVSKESRVIIFGSDPALVSKNRFGITKPVAFRLDTNPLVGVIPGFESSSKKARAPEAMPEEDVEEEVAESVDEQEDTDAFADASHDAADVSSFDQDTIVDPEPEPVKDNKKVARDIQALIMIENRSSEELKFLAENIDSRFSKGEINASQKETLHKILHARRMILDANTFDGIDLARDAIAAVPDIYRKDGKLDEFLKIREAEISATAVATKA